MFSINIYKHLLKIIIKKINDTRLHIALSEYLLTTQNSVLRKINLRFYAFLNTCKIKVYYILILYCL